MAVNYTMQSVPINVNANSNWTSQDVYLPSLGDLASSEPDGIVDQSSVPLRMIIVPNDGYVVSASDFTIGGLGPSQIVQSTFFSTGAPANISELGENLVNIQNVRYWNNIVPPEPYDLPSYIDGIRMYDSSTPGAIDNTVVVLAHIDDYYDIEEENITITLNIDGDAQLYVPETPSNQFTISVELTSDTPNASVFSVIPMNLNSNVNETPSSWVISPVDPDGNFNKASVLCTYNDSVESQETAKLLYENTSSHNQAWFWIVPNNNYYVSRNNFYIENGGISSEISETGALTGVISGTYLTNTYSSNFQAGANLSDYQQAESIPPGSTNVLAQGKYAYTGYGTLLSSSNAFFDLDGVTTNATAVYGGQFGNYTTSALLYGSKQILLIDTISDYESFESVEYPYNLLPSSFTNGDPGENVCANDWDNNAILIAFNGIKDHVPGSTPSDITLKLSGQAMYDDGFMCSDVELELIADCIDGFDLNGNPC